MQLVVYLIVGLVVGGVSGALGIGGGILLVPLLMAIGPGGQLKAQGITLAVLAVPVVLPGVYQYYQQGHLTRKDIVAAGWIACGFAVGTYYGAWIKESIPLSTLRLGFGFMLFYVAARFLLAASPEATRGFKIIMSFTAVGLAWIVFFGLRVIGRRAARKPKWPDVASIDQSKQDEEPEYYI